MAAVEAECADVLLRLSEVVQTNEGPSFFQNSCTGLQTFDSPENNGKTSHSSTSNMARSGCAASSREETEGERSDADILNADGRGWTKSLANIPIFTHERLENKLVKNSRTMPDKIAPKAHRNMKKGYGLWKEGYVKSILVKPNIQATKMLFLVKARVSASMKSVSYPVYAHLNQADGEVEYAKCCCKAGQGGCCKHVAALLYTVLDFVNLNLQQIPEEFTCTQVAQKWSVPSGSSKTLKEAVKFNELLFEKSDVNKSNKRYLVKGTRKTYCAAPPFAQTVTEGEIKTMANAFREVNRASLFCEALESNNYTPCDLFETSCSQLRKRKQDILPSNDLSLPTPDELLVNEIFKNVPSDYNPPLNCSQAQLELLTRTVGLSMSSAKEICSSTVKQSQDAQWYVERQTRVTASIFGKVINRRKSTYPTSLVQTITTRAKLQTTSMPASLQWGLDNEEKAILKYRDEMLDKEKNEVKKCGFVISPKWPWLGCSPDGIIVNNGVPVGCIEVKCPYSNRDMSVHVAGQQCKSFYLKQTENGLKLKVNHAYYYQCQGLMNILGLDWTDFIVYTNVDMHVERIYKDVSLWDKKMLPALTSFYLSFILPACSKAGLD